MANHILLETIHLTQDAASVTFDNIPQTGYTDLKIIMSARSTHSAVVEGVVVRFNGDNTSGNYSYRRIYGNGASAVSDTSSVPVFMDGATATANTFTSNELYLPNYTSSVAKSMSVNQAHENNATTAYVALTAALWTGTAAINSITFTSENAASFVSGSTFSLYGVAAIGTTPAVAPSATGGNIVANDGTYWYHAFLSSGIFTPQTALTCDALVIAGGGGAYGNRNDCGGGGAGGFRALTSQSFAANSYFVAIGAGGAGGQNATAGSNSSISTLSATGGGFAGGSGGSGSGGNRDGGTSGGAGNAGGYSPVEGYAGGTSPSGSWIGAGGGGGAGGTGYGGVGGSATAERGGYGGIGAYSAISGGAATGLGVLSGGNYYFAGGGGGGSESNGRGGVATGGLGGGGNGCNGNATAATSGTANTGGGGGGAGISSGSGGSGGSGIVIIRYAM